MLRRSLALWLALCQPVLAAKPVVPAAVGGRAASAKAGSAGSIPVLPQSAAKAAARPENGAAAEPARALPVLERTEAARAQPGLQASAFDGGDSGDARPTVVEQPGGPTPPLPPAGKKPKSLHTHFDDAAGYAVLAAGAAPAVWNIQSILTSAGPAAAALVVLTLAAAPWAAVKMWRRLSGGPESVRPPPARAAVWKARLAGALAGAALFVAADSYRLEAALAVDRLLPPATQQLARLEGGVFEKELIAELSGNPQGRAVLEALRDRSGKIRLPPFAVRGDMGGNATAGYRPLFDVVLLNGGHVARFGWTTEELLKDPARQRAFIKAYADILVHELAHTGQSRRFLISPDQWIFSMAIEHEAFLIQHFYRHEELKKNPSSEAGPVMLKHYELVLDDLDAYLEMVDESYKRSAPLATPTYKAMRARWQKDWAAHRAEGYELLARRHAGTPQEARYREKARQVK